MDARATRVRHKVIHKVPRAGVTLLERGRVFSIPKGIAKDA